MLQGARRIWRRLVCGKAVEDRRALARRPSDVVTAIQPPKGEARRPARVLDVSRGGVGLAVGEALEPGAVIGVEVPAGSGVSSSVALACVVHVQPHGEREWLLGCAFCQELSDDDLAAFGGKPVSPQPELRGAERFPCNVRASFQLVGQGSGRYSARVLNISLGGAGLLAERPVAVGALLNLELESADGGSQRTLLACVVHVATRPGNEWVLGCNFLHELPEADLQDLL